jgi:polysaccharide biosynthesis protein PslG
LRIAAPGGRPLIYLALALALGVSILPISRAPRPPDANYFAETGFTVSGRFLEVWMGTHTYQDGVAINGYPISDAHDEVNPADGKTYRVQWFERARFELHPDQAPPNDVQLGLLGKDAVWNTRRDEPPFQPVAQPANAGATLAWVPETRHTIRGAFLTFWTRYGGTQQFGYPLSEEFSEINALDHRPYTVQYFERSRFEYHPGLAPEYGGVVLGQLGKEQYHPAATPTPGGP